VTLAVQKGIQAKALLLLANALFYNNSNRRRYRRGRGVVFVAPV
jgi:hypothetical protein